MSHRRLVLAVALFALAGGAALLMWQGGRRPQTATLSDGTKLTLHAVQAGTTASYCFGSLPQRIAARLPVPKVRRWAEKSMRRAWFGEQTNLALWFTAAPTAPGTAQYQFRIIHDDGTNAVRFQRTAPMRVPSGDIALCYFTPLWPRRSKFITVQAFADLRPLPEKPEWQFVIRNPVFAEYPQWPPEQFPAMRTVGDTQFTLHELPPAGLTSASQPAVEARLRVTCRGQPCDDWSVCGVQFRDATGNRVQTTPGDATRTEAGRWWVRVRGQLFEGEEAAKIGVGFVRTANFATNDLVVFRAVPLQLTKTFPAVQTFTNALTGRVQITLYATPGDPARECHAFVSSAEPLAGDITAPGARWFLVLGAVDDQGRTVALKNTDLDASSSRRFIAPAGAKTLDITVAAPRVVFVEWTASQSQILARPR